MRLRGGDPVASWQTAAYARDKAPSAHLPGGFFFFPLASTVNAHLSQNRNPRHSTGGFCCWRWFPLICLGAVRLPRRYPHSHSTVCLPASMRDSIDESRMSSSYRSGTHRQLPGSCYPGSGPTQRRRERSPFLADVPQPARRRVPEPPITHLATLPPASPSRTLRRVGLSREQSCHKPHRFPD